MKRKWFVVMALTALILALCAGAALADAPSFTRQPAGGTIVPDGGREISWTTNFTPTRVVLGYSYYFDGGFWGGSGWRFAEKKTIETGLQPDMKTVITYTQAATSDRWVVRAYYDETQYEESECFSIKLPESLRTIGTAAFSNCAIPDITVPPGVTAIGINGILSYNGYTLRNFTMYGYIGTEAQRYSSTHDTITFVPLDLDVLELYGYMDGAPVACDEGTEPTGAYRLSETAEAGVYTLTVQFSEDSYVSVRRSKKDREGLTNVWYAANSSPSEACSAVLTASGAPAASDDMLFVPGDMKCS